MNRVKLAKCLLSGVLTMWGLWSLPFMIRRVEGMQEVRFNRDIRPILSERCMYCHGPDEKNRKAGLRLDTFEGATKDRGGYRAIAPGKPDESELLRRVTSHEAGEVMPPPAAKKSPITAQEADLLRRWIAEGARYEGHWAYQPLARAVPPPVKQVEWIRNGIDRFVLARLEREGVRPSPPADARTLIRRLSLDLTGLLPAPAEVEQFAKSFERAGRAGQDALYAALVDRLLASPHYGERWGRHWLDQARYADTNGYTIDGERVMWPYRDWVIRSLNEDKPFDRFTIEQLAGDLLPVPADPARAKAQLVATGFHRNTVINEEGGVDPEQARVEQVMDRANTTGAVWLGLTVGCAQCHSHKYDPISNREYYQMLAFFNSTMDYNNLGPTVFVEKGELLGRREPAAEPKPLLQAEWEKSEIARLEKSAAVSAPAKPVEWLPFRVIKYDTEAAGPLRQLADGSFLITRNGSLNDAYRLLGTIDRPGVPAVRLTVMGGDELPVGGPGLGTDGSFVLSEFYIESEGGGHRFAEAFTVEEAPGWPARTATDNDRRTGWSVGAGKSSREAIFVFGPQKKFDSRQIQFVLRHDARTGSGIGRFRIEIASEVPHDAAGAALLAALRTPAAARDKAQQSLIAAGFADARAVREKQAGKAVMAMIMREVAEPRQSYIFTRGDFTRPDIAAGRLQPNVLAAIAPALPEVTRTRTRLDLAQWLVHPENPLTPRVTINRIWMRYFGRGIVETEEDFGTQGAQPTHPELLDWLSGELIRQGWSLKAIHRLIVNSATYRQSSKARTDEPRLAEIDPRNLLLARQERLRVEAEIVRDAALSASGLLNTRIGGPGVRPPQPDGVYAFTQVNKRWMTATDDERYRRALYTFFVRSAPYPLFTTFDAPDFQTVCTRRARSNTPLQSLTLANDSAFIEIAQGLAMRLARDLPGGFASRLDDRLRHAFRLTLTREPQAAELAVLRGYVERQVKGFEARPDSAIGLVGDKPLTVGGLTRAEAAALTAAARVLFNTDNFITRE
jgi:hypothetical protein